MTSYVSNPALAQPVVNVLLTDQWGRLYGLAGPSYDFGDQPDNFVAQLRSQGQRALTSSGLIVGDALIVSDALVL